MYFVRGRQGPDLYLAGQCLGETVEATEVIAAEGSPPVPVFRRAVMAEAVRQAVVDGDEDRLDVVVAAVRADDKFAAAVATVIQEVGDTEDRRSDLPPLPDSDEEPAPIPPEDQYEWWVDRASAAIRMMALRL